MASVVVIGAGVGGLAVAARLADFGHRVTVVERNADVGGQVASHTVDGVRFDIGPTTFTLPAVFRDLFRKTGRPIEREVEVIPVDPAVRYVLSGGIAVDLPNASRAGTIQALDAALGGGAGEQWDNVIRQAAAIWRVARPRIIEVPFSTRDAARLTLSPAIRRTVTRPGGLRALGDKHLRDHRLQDMLDTYATSWGADPASAPAALAMLAYIQQTFGIWTVRGGLQHLVEALRQRVEDLGGVVRVQCTVDSVARERGRAAGVRLAGGETLDADVVVSAVSAEHLYRDLVSTHRVGRLRSRLRGGRSVFTMLLALRGQPAGLPQRTVLVADEDGPAIIVMAPTSAPAGPVQPWVLHTDCAPHGTAPGSVDWTEPGLADRHADRTLALAAARGVDLRPLVVSRDVRTPLHLEQSTGAPGGRVFGTPWRGAGAILHRPANRSPVPGLYLAGAGSHPGPGLPMVGISAAIVADLIGRA